ncbi:hypothetical protein G5B37_09535 [Rasiella rasia]|uniref:Lipoprotein n=1 Tax=Rasiella rasia TaxID=2744027 RepID=A0A6G6GMI6_9FLAO|nr:hypothetical protein [Rasiella rasia]QIE59796.1 hypothetical protein G5B37_09535 [Rasiella rasia]
MYKLILLSFITIASCGTPKNTADAVANPTSQTTAELKNQTIILALGEHVMLGSLKVHFKEVMEDSRCPTGTNCFWQGRAKLLVETSEDEMTVESNELIFGKLKPGETNNHTFYQSGKTTLIATAINPYPTSETGTAALDYKLVIDVVIK